MKFIEVNGAILLVESQEQRMAAERLISMLYNADLLEEPCVAIHEADAHVLALPPAQLASRAISTGDFVTLTDPDGDGEPETSAFDEDFNDCEDSWEQSYFEAEDRDGE